MLLLLVSLLGSHVAIRELVAFYHDPAYRVGMRFWGADLIGPFLDVVVNLFVAIFGGNHIQIRKYLIAKGISSLAGIISLSPT